MQIPFLNTLARNRFAWSLIVALSGIFLSILIFFFYTRLTSTYATFMAMVILFPFVTIIIQDIKRLLWVLLIILMPITIDITINMDYSHVGGAAGYMISAYDIILALLYLLWIVEFARKKVIRIHFFSQIFIPTFFFICLVWLSMIWSKYPHLSKFEAIEVTKMYFTFFYLSNNLKNKKDIHLIVILFSIMLLFESFLGLLQHRYGIPFFPTILGGPSWVGNRISGTWTSFNDFSWYLTFFIPLIMSMHFAKINYLFKMFYFIILFFSMGSLMWTSSRAGWLSIIIAGGFITVFIFSKIKEKSTYIHIFFTAIAIIILISPLYPRLYTKVYYRFFGDDGGSAESRIPHMQVALNIIRANPFVGIGLNNYTEIMYDYDDTELGLREYSRYPVHNIYLHMTAELGIIGLFLFSSIMFSIYLKGIHYIISNEGELVYVVIGLLAGIIAFLFHGLVDAASVGNKMFLFVWFFAGIIFAITAIKEVEEVNSNK